MNLAALPDGGSYPWSDDREANRLDHQEAQSLRSGDLAWMNREAERLAATIARLDDLTARFTAAGLEYDLVPAGGAWNAMLADEMHRGAAQLRLVAHLVGNGSLTNLQGRLWIRAARQILNTIGSTSNG